MKWPDKVPEEEFDAFKAELKLGGYTLTTWVPEEEGPTVYYIYNGRPGDCEPEGYYIRKKDYWVFKRYRFSEQRYDP